ncbi:MAG: cysteine desulfurase [Thermomicrobiales bacterium]|nr:cysteine desulfurase [Thermomicrobiales bacterium]
MFDAAAVKRDFPILNQGGAPPLTFLDSAASSQKPQAVIDALVNYYTTINSNVHRGVYKLAVAADHAYDGTREHVARFINATSPDEIVFTRGTTEAINLVAATWGRTNLREGDLVVSTVMEHHSCFVPWQMIALEVGARIEAVRITESGELDQDHYRELLSQNPKVVAFTQVSNVLGTINPVKEMTAQAHAAGAVVCIDAAQSVPHMAVDVQDLDVDFLAFSAHKMLGPMGIGVLYGKRSVLESMPPYQGGGSMIRKVTLEKTTWADIPSRFEAGTPSVGDVVGLGAAIDYLQDLGYADIARHEHELAAAAIIRLSAIPGVTVYGPGVDVARAGVVSFVVDGVHPHDVAALLDERGVAVRAGHHCAQPLMKALGVTATTRASFYVYNTIDDVDRLIEGVEYAQRVFA